MPPAFQRGIILPNVEPVDKFALCEEIALWQEKWICQRTIKQPNKTIPKTVIEGLLACDSDTFPII